MYVLFDIYFFNVYDMYVFHIHLLLSTRLPELNPRQQAPRLERISTVRRRHLAPDALQQRAPLRQHHLGRGLCVV